MVKKLVRKFLAARADLATKLSKIAKSRNVTLYGLLNEILEQAIRANDFGDDLSQILDNHFFIKMAKKNGFILVPEKIWCTILEETFGKNEESLNSAFYNVGSWYGKYFSTVFSNNDAIEQVEKALKSILWNVPNLNLAKNGNEITLQCTEPKFTDSHTAFLSTIFEGIIHSFGYATDAKDVSRGIISLTFKKTKC